MHFPSIKGQEGSPHREKGYRNRDEWPPTFPASLAQVHRETASQKPQKCQNKLCRDAAFAHLQQARQCVGSNDKDDCEKAIAPIRLHVEVVLSAVRVAQRFSSLEQNCLPPARRAAMMPGPSGPGRLQPGSPVAERRLKTGWRSALALQFAGRKKRLQPLRYLPRSMKYLRG